jgi:SAM-dependent methyltransferase
MNLNCARFVVTALSREDVEGKKILEVGSLDVNGSARPFVELLKPAEYLGSDITSGRGVDVVCDVNDIVKRFGPNRFDVVLSTEMLEHIRDWRAAVHAIKTVCKPGGVIVITTRSMGFPYHGYPFDYWRYETEDLTRIFKDCNIENIEKDPDRGVFIKVRKPEQFIEADLVGHALYSIAHHKRVSEVDENATKTLYFKWVMLKPKVYTVLYGIRDILFFKM